MNTKQAKRARYLARRQDRREAHALYATFTTDQLRELHAAFLLDRGNLPPDYWQARGPQ